MRYRKKSADIEMRRQMICVVAMALLSTQAAAGQELSAVLYKNPSCTCCGAYADYLRSNGLKVKVVEHSNMTLIKQQYGVSKDVEGCHSTVIGNYVIEGHVPFLTIKKMLSDKPAIKGISLPGMPAGSPGMGGAKQGPFNILSITNSNEPTAVFATE